MTLNGRAITASGLSTEAGRKPIANEMLGEFLVIPDGTKMPLLDVVQPVAAKVAAADAAPAAAAKLPGPTTPKEAPAPEPKAPEEPMQTAALDPDPESAQCDLDEKYNIIGFNANSNELTPRLIERLDQVAADIGERQCNVTVTGYSSKQGTIASNALFAVERAQNSLRYLQQKGVKFIKASATGVGATDEFGPDFASNRRVVITVTP